MKCKSVCIGSKTVVLTRAHTGKKELFPDRFEILHALKCVLGASEVPFRACIQYIPTCQLPSLFSGFRSKSTTYEALASGCAEVT